MSALHFSNRQGRQSLPQFFAPCRARSWQRGRYLANAIDVYAELCPSRLNTVATDTHTTVIYAAAVALFMRPRAVDVRRRSDPSSLQTTA